MLDDDIFKFMFEDNIIIMSQNYDEQVFVRLMEADTAMDGEPNAAIDHDSPPDDTNKQHQSQDFSPPPDANMFEPDTSEPASLHEAEEEAEHEGTTTETTEHATDNTNTTTTETTTTTPDTENTDAAGWTNHEATEKTATEDDHTTTWFSEEITETDEHTTSLTQDDSTTGHDDGDHEHLIVATETETETTYTTEEHTDDTTNTTNDTTNTTHDENTNDGTESEAPDMVDMVLEGKRSLTRKITRATSNNPSAAGESRSISPEMIANSETMDRINDLGELA